MHTNHRVVHDPPLVTTAYLYRDAESCRAMLRDREAYVLFFFFNYETPATAAAKLAMIQREYPRITFRAAVDRAELFEALWRDFPVVLAHQNALVDARVFRPMPEVRLLYPAVYTAATTPGKRHHLADDIPGWLWITYMPNADGMQHFQRLRGELRNVRIPQYAARYWYWDNRQVAYCLNEAEVGLCLTEHEGGMWAVTEYLLSGLPVVVTNDSVGGMHTVLPRDFVAYVAPDAAAVARAARGLAARNIPRHDIRDAEQAILRPHLQALQGALQELCDLAGIRRDICGEWDALFHDKFYGWGESPLLRA